MRVSLVAVIMSAIFMCSCASNTTSTLSQQDQAISAGYEMAKAYQDLYATYASTKTILEANGKQIPESITKSMNTLKKSIIVYNDAVILWSKTGGKPENLDSERSSILCLVTDLTSNLISLGVI